MKIKTKILPLNGKGRLFFWLIPSILFKYGYLKTQDYGEFQWLHIYFSWLVWSLDVELTIKDGE